MTTCMNKSSAIAKHPLGYDQFLLDFDQRRLDLSSPNPPSLDFNNPRSLKLPDSSSGSTSPERDQRPGMFITHHFML